MENITTSFGKQGNLGIFEIYLPASKPEDATILVNATIDTKTSEISIELKDALNDFAIRLDEREVYLLSFIKLYINKVIEVESAFKETYHIYDLLLACEKNILPDDGVITLKGYATASWIRKGFKIELPALHTEIEYILNERTKGFDTIKILKYLTNISSKDEDMQALMELHEMQSLFEKLVEKNVFLKYPISSEHVLYNLN